VELQPEVFSTKRENRSGGLEADGLTACHQETPTDKLSGPAGRMEWEKEVDLRKLGPRRVAVLLLAAGALVYAAVYLYLTFVYLPSLGYPAIQPTWFDILSMGIVFGFLAALYSVAAPTTVWLLKAHQRVVTEIFQKALAEELAPGPILATNAMVNFVSITVLCLLPFRELVLGSFPVLKPAEALIPSSIFVGAGTNSTLIAIFVATVPGRAVVFALRYLREDNPNRGDTLCHVFLVLFYASLVLALLSIRQSTTISGIPAEWYGRLILLVLLPGNVGGTGILMFLLSSEWAKKTLTYVK